MLVAENPKRRSHAGGRRHRQVTIEGKQPRRLPRPGELPKVALVVRPRPITVAGAYAPVHTPAPVRRPSPAEQLLQRGQRPAVGGLTAKSITVSGSANAHHPSLCRPAEHASLPRSALD